MLEEISDSGLNCFCETASNRAGRCRLNVEEKVKLTLGQYLASIRLDRNLSLRQVEEKSNKAVSNAYLSQLETGKILQPNPTVLNALAEVYDISYLQLMKLAGYLPPSASSEPSQRHGRLATFAEHNLTPEEEKELMDFLQYLRSKKQP